MSGVPDPKRHAWRINDGEPTHGYGVICDRCKIELVPCVDMVGLAPQAALYVAGRGERYEPRKHGRCVAADVPATTGDGLAAETLAAMEAAAVDVAEHGVRSVADALAMADYLADSPDGDVEWLMEHGCAVADHLRREVRRLTAALDGVRREERARCKRECMVIAGELSYDFRLRQGMHAAERCAKAIGALPDAATGSAT
jgi:hypothetical protein